MAFSTINKSSLYQSNVLYTGNNTGQSITGVGFQPDFIWNKARTNTETHNVWDAVRGTGKAWVTSNNGGEQSWSTGVTSFDSDGWTMGVLDSMNDGSVPYASWNFKANGAGSSDSSGSAPTATVSANTTAGFSIVKYTTGSVGAGMTVPHGLGVKPDLIIFKKLNATGNPTMYHKDAGGYLYINTNAAVTANTTWVTATSSLVTLANTWELYNSASSTYVMYCFAEKTGYSKFGKYVGNNSADGPFIFTGFKPKFVMIKNTHTTTNWSITDDKRAGFNVDNDIIYANTDGAEDGSYQPIDHLSNGFKIRLNTEGYNGNGGDYIYMAFGQPIISNSGTVATAR
jgi:hypothetical protein